MTIWFTSDTHFWHRNIQQYCNRPGESVEGMNELLIQRWNERVKPNEEVYHLGDFFFCGVTKAEEILKRLNGIKFWIKGNHDYKQTKLAEPYFQWVRDYYRLMVHDVHQAEDDETSFQQYHQPIILSHYPILSWDGMAHGSWHLHGHCHGSIDNTWNKTGMRKDVGVDTNNLYPYSYEEIKNIMAIRSVVPTDHHV